MDRGVCKGDTFFYFGFILFHSIVAKAITYSAHIVAGIIIWVEGSR